MVGQGYDTGGSDTSGDSAPRLCSAAATELSVRPFMGKLPSVSDSAFVVTQIGDKGSVERKRADEITDYVIKPVLDEFDLGIIRADRDPTPGQITPQMLRTLLEAKVVIADLTGRNPNVYYELAVAQSFSKPTITMVDLAVNVAFDSKDERLIELGEYKAALSVPQAEDAKKALRSALKVVLAEGYKPSSLVAEVATARSIDDLAPENPMASELASLRETVDEIRTLVARPRVSIPRNVQAEREVLRELVERLATEPGALAALRTADREETSTAFDQWLDRVMENAASWASPKQPAQDDPWATPPGGWAEEPPF